MEKGQRSHVHHLVQDKVSDRMGYSWSFWYSFLKVWPISDWYRSWVSDRVLHTTSCHFVLTWSCVFVTVGNSERIFSEAHTHLRFAQTIIVGNVKGISGGSRVHTSCAAFLQTQVVQDFGEAWILQKSSIINSVIFMSSSGTWAPWEEEKGWHKVKSG